MSFAITPFPRCLLIAFLSFGLVPAHAETSAPKYATLDESIARGDVEDVKRHLARDPAAAKGKPDARLAPLHQAILRRQAAIVDLLLTAGANPSGVDASGRSPLHLAVDRGDLALVTSLLNAKSDATLRDRTGWTPLHLAAAKARVEIATALLDAGTSPHLLSAAGGTPLHEAAASGGVGMVKLLLDRGVDPAVVSQHGVTALQIARQFEQTDVVALLSSLTK